jgi:hypothetical protein
MLVYLRIDQPLKIASLRDKIQQPHDVRWALNDFRIESFAARYAGSFLDISAHLLRELAGALVQIIFRHDKARTPRRQLSVSTGLTRQ